MCLVIYGKIGQEDGTGMVYFWEDGADIFLITGKCDRNKG